MNLACCLHVFQRNLPQVSWMECVFIRGVGEENQIARAVTVTFVVTGSQT